MSDSEETRYKWIIAALIFFAISAICILGGKTDKAIYFILVCIAILIMVNTK